jgi:hypothetical protein
MPNIEHAAMTPEQKVYFSFSFVINALRQSHLLDPETF